MLAIAPRASAWRRSKSRARSRETPDRDLGVAPTGARAPSTENLKLPFTHLLLILIVCLAWGFNFVACAAALLEWPPFLFTIVRFSLVALALSWLVKPPPRAQWPRLVAVCLCMGAIHFTLYFLALRLSADISSIAVAMQTYVPMSAVLAVLLLGERVRWRTATAIAVAFAGVLVIGFDPLVVTQLDALALTLASAFFLALGTIMMRHLAGIDPYSFQGWTALISLPALLVGTVLFEQHQVELVLQAGWMTWGGALYSAIGASIIGHGLYFHLVRQHPVAEITPYLLLAPVVGIGFGVLLWGDEPGWRLLVGAAMVLGGVLAVALRARSRLTHRAP